MIFGQFIYVDIRYLCLQVIHEGEKVVVLELVISVPTKEVEQQRGVHWLSCNKKQREKIISYCKEF
jgi:hypothetical protein